MISLSADRVKGCNIASLMAAVWSAVVSKVCRAASLFASESAFLRKKVIIISNFSFLITTISFLYACSAESDPQQDTNPVAVDFALTVAKMSSAGTAGMTRMTVANTEGSSDNILLRCAIPFKVDRDIRIGDTYSSTPILGGFVQPRQNMPFFMAECTFDADVCSVLAYGCERVRSAGHAKGALVETLLDDETQSVYQPANIKFELKSIQKSDEYLGINGDTDETTVAEELAAYLTSIANAKTAEKKTWKDDAFDASLKLLYKNFINQLSEGVGAPLPGSAANVKEWGKQLKANLEALDFNTGTTEQNTTDYAIRTAIETEIANWKSTWEGFPFSKGLPDGAAVVRWQTVKKENNSEVEEFVVETQTTTIADINNIERFTFPAEIYYYGNSLVMVSDADLSGNFQDKNKWAKASIDDTEAAVLDGFTVGPVTGTTSTVAMKDPLQYGVSRLMVNFHACASSLPDSKGVSHALGGVDDEKFPLTGVIVGGQLPVGFDFSPASILDYYSESNMRFIYDNQFESGSTFYLTTADAGPTYTLVLQSYDHKSLKLVLEFKNNSGKAFEGLNGTVYPGTKFYLVGDVVPTNKTKDILPYDNRVFTKDHTTTVNVEVRSLAKAYNVLPNLLSPRLEMGLELTPKWEQATTSDVEL